MYLYVICLTYVIRKVKKGLYGTLEQISYAFWILSSFCFIYQKVVLGEAIKKILQLNYNLKKKNKLMKII